MHPILFRIPTPWGDLPIYSYGVMLGTSLIFAWYFIMKVGTKKERIQRELLANCFLFTAITAIVASRLLYILTNLDEFETFGKWFEFRSGGLVAYGGFLGGFAGSWFFLWRKKVPLAPWADLVAPTLGSGLFFTRIGCYLYGCDFGRPLGDDAPGWLKGWGTFPRWDIDSASLACDASVSGSPAFNHHTRTMDLAADAHYSLPVHPTQLYESTVGLVLFGVGVLMLQKRRYRGQVIVVVAALYAVWRFFIEYLRDDPERGAALGFSTSQLISILVLPLCVLGHVFLSKRHKEKGDPAIPASALIGAETAGAKAKTGKASAARGKAGAGTVKKKKKAAKPPQKEAAPAAEKGTDDDSGGSDTGGARKKRSGKKKRKKPASKG